MKAYWADYEESWRFGGYYEIRTVVIANTESEALGFVLAKYDDTSAYYWSIFEIDTNNPGVIFFDVVSES